MRVNSPPPDNTTPCPTCNEPIEFEGPSDDRDELGRGEDFPAGYNCCDCGRVWTIDEINDRKREAARVARHVARTIGKIDQARKTAKLARDILEGGAA